MARVKGTRGYNNYRGRGSGGKKLLAVLLVLVVLASAAFMIAQRHVVYEADGSFHFDLPWGKPAAGEKTDAPPLSGSVPSTPQSDLEIVVETPASTDLCAYELDESVLRGSWEATVEMLDKQINAVAVRVRAADGTLLYDSHVADAAECGAVVGSSVARAAIKGLTESDYYTIACFSTLHDNYYSFAHMVDAAIQQINYSGYIWYATDSTFYLAPEKEAARAYLAALASEVAEMGFDELLLDEFGYPTAGRLSNIKTDERTMTQIAALCLLADELKAAIGERKLSVRVDEATFLAGSNEASGVDVAELIKHVDRVYVETTEGQVPTLQELAEKYGCELIPILADAAPVGSYFIAK